MTYFSLKFIQHHLILSEIINYKIQLIEIKNRIMILFFTGNFVNNFDNHRDSFI